MSLEKLFERTMSLSSYNEITNPDLVAFIRYKSDSPRSTTVLEKIKYTYLVEIVHTMQASSDISTSANIIDEITVYVNGEFESKYSCLNLADLFQMLGERFSTLFIDITDIGVRLMSIICTNLAECFDENKNLFSAVYCGYTEPKEYIKSDPHSAFRLYQAFDPVSALPKLASEGIDNDTQVWVVFLGFEGDRVNAVQEEIGRIDKIIAALTVPSMKLGWTNYVFEFNSHFLQGVDRENVPEIAYIPAQSPFAAYNYLCEYQNKHYNSRLLISPFGTKSNSLGAILYAINNRNCAVVFDNPLETTRVAEETSDVSHVYEITAALKVVRQ